MSESYKTLNDAAEATGINGLRPGKTEIWFMNEKGWEIFSRGPALALKTGHALPIGHDVGKSGTHILLGEIQATNLGGIFGIMQGEQWSPRGEGNGLIRSKGLHHSSMSVGDIIVHQNGSGAMVDSVGFFDLPPTKADQKDQVRKAQGDISPLLRKESAGMRETLRQLEEAQLGAPVEVRVVAYALACLTEAETALTKGAVDRKAADAILKGVRAAQSVIVRQIKDDEQLGGAMNDETLAFLDALRSVRPILGR